MSRHWVPLGVAWQEALYGPHGFYRRQSPADHFRTSPAASGLFAAALAELAHRLDLSRIVDVGAGSGRLLGDLAEGDPSLDLVGVDLRSRPDGLASAVRWLPEAPHSDRALLVANELLDNIACDVVELDGDGVWRIVEVEVSTGAQRIGAAASGDARAWLARWWPRSEAGARAEVGLARDVFWAELCARVDGGMCVAVDYGHVAADRPAGGTVASYRGGRLVEVRFDGSCDVTAHVAFDSLAAATRGTLRRQRDVLADLGLTGRRPDIARASTDPRGYLRDLTRAGEAAELTAAGGLGDFYWLLSPRP